MWFPAVVAPFVGSLLGVLIRRLPRAAPDLWGRSACEACGHILRPWELAPLLSYAAQRGRCRACGARIAPAHLAVELSAVAVALAAIAVGPDVVTVWEGCALGWTLLALAWLDAAQFWLPDVLTLPLLVGGLADAWALAPWGLTDRAAGAAAGYAAFRLIAWAYWRLRGRDGLGEGDAKLLAAGGAWLGWAALPDVVLLAAVLGIATALLARLRGTRLSRTMRLPFGSMLATAIWASWLAAAWLDLG